MNPTALALVVLAYAAITGFLGWLGYRNTRSAADYLVGGRGIHPVLMALAYGSTFISTSAIVGFGGAAALYGLGLLWLTALNILIGIFIAFVVFGRATRRLGARLDAHTFPELLGRRFRSRFIQGFAGTVIAALMPLYAAAVLVGGARFLEVQLGVPYGGALLGFAVLTVGYVLFGGLKGVVYTDAFQAGVMFLGMIVLLVATYAKVGGAGAHAALTALTDKVPAALVAGGHRGWTAMPALGSPIWWQLVSTIVLGVGVGVLAQPQLTIRFMTVKSGKELHRALVPGSIFILAMTGVAFVVGALSNLYFFQRAGKIALAVVTDPTTGKPNIDKVIPTFVMTAMPPWFGYLFMLTLLAAAMSTLSAQFHVIGSSIGRDVYQQAIARGAHAERTVPLAKVGTFLAFLATLALAWRLPPGIVAIATALFFGMCAATFLPAYVAALFWPRATRAGVTAGMMAGLASWAGWVLLVHEKEAAALGVARLLAGRASLAAGTVWTVVDPIVIALPVAAVVTIAGSLATAAAPMPDAVAVPGEDAAAV
ncbi:MAG: sodium:solute symporter [Anaeromyxobacteraceae bacterium]